MAAGVSRQTVSNVVNAPDRVSPRTRGRVEEVIERLGYRPHRGAVNFKARRTGLIGYRVPASTGSINAVLDRFLHALSDAARLEGFHVLLFTPEAGQDELTAQAELLATRTVDGFVVSETNYGDPRAQALGAAGVPFVTFGRTDLQPAHPWVDVDGGAGTRDAVAHLVERGHRRIAFLGWPEGSVSGDQRALGFVEGLRQAGLAADDALDVRAPDGLEGGLAALDQWRQLPDPPSAVVAATDLLALGVLRGAREAGLTVGSDLAVTGFDDTPTAALMSPPLTSLRQPLEEVAAAVVHLLVGRVGGLDVPTSGLSLAPELVIRDSTSPPSRTHTKGTS